MVSPSAFIKRYAPVVISSANNVYDYRLAAVNSVYEAGRLLLPSGYMLEEKQAVFLASLKKHKIK